VLPLWVAENLPFSPAPVSFFFYSFDRPFAPFAAMLYVVNIRLFLNWCILHECVFAVFFFFFPFCFFCFFSGHHRRIDVPRAVLSGRRTSVLRKLMSPPGYLFFFFLFLDLNGFQPDGVPPELPTINHHPFFLLLTFVFHSRDCACSRLFPQT